MLALLRLFSPIPRVLQLELELEDPVLGVKVAQARVKEPSRFQGKSTFDIKVLGLAINHIGLLLPLCGEGSLRLVLPIFNFWHVKVI